MLMQFVKLADLKENDLLIDGHLSALKLIGIVKYINRGHTSHVTVNQLNGQKNTLVYGPDAFIPILRMATVERWIPTLVANDEYRVGDVILVQNLADPEYIGVVESSNTDAKGRTSLTLTDAIGIKEKWGQPSPRFVLRPSFSILRQCSLCHVTFEGSNDYCEDCWDDLRENTLNDDGDDIGDYDAYPRGSKGYSEASGIWD